MDGPEPSPPPDVDALFARHLPPLVAFVRARTGRAVAARESAIDIAQSVCREVLQDLGKLEFRGDEAFRGWLFMQATRKILDRNRFLHRDRRDVGREQAPSEAEAESLLTAYATLATPSRCASAREELARIEAAVHDLPEAQRDAVTMSRLMGMGYTDIAQIMDLTESAVRGLVARGLAAIAAKLG
ncbi:MAG: RNA polymerase sigma factor [Planctomycetota bacterium]